MTTKVKNDTPTKPIKLMKSRQFAPLFWTQFFSALNDNFVKTTVIFLILSVISTESQSVLMTLTSAVFIVPSLLFSATGGQLADRFDKARITRTIKFFEMFAAFLAVGAFLFSSVAIMMFALFLLGICAALFGPAKYAILPEQLDKSQLPRANAWVEAGTFISILLGMILVSFTFASHGQAQYLPAILILLFAVISWAASRFIPLHEAKDANLKINYNILSATQSLMKTLSQDKRLLTVALMISWFWFMGIVLISVVQMLPQSLGGFKQGFALFFTVMAISAAIGSAITAWLSAGRIVLLQAVIGTLISGLACLDLSYTIYHLDSSIIVNNWSQFLSHPGLIRLNIDVALAAMSSSFLVVPGFAALQAWAKDHERARIIAANNILNSAIMAAGAGIMALAFYCGLSLDMVVFSVGILSIIVSFIMLKFLPTNPFRDFVSILFRAFFRLEVKGMENFAKAGDTPILALNHVSLLDGLLALAVCETTALNSPAFAIHSDIARRWWIRPFLQYINAFPMDPTRPLAARRLIRKVQDGSPLVIFPEGRITVTGALMKVYDGAAMVADKTGAKVVPIKIDGLERTYFSRLNGIQTRRQFFPKVSVTVTEPVTLQLKPELKSRARREAAGNELYNIMSDLLFNTSSKTGTVFEELVKASENFGMSAKAIEDPMTGALNYGMMLTSIRAVAVKFAKRTKGQKNIGLLLPNSNVAAVSFFALQSAGKTPAMLNFSVGLATLKSATKAAKVTRIVTSRAFLRQARLEDMAKALRAENISFIYLEDLKKAISILDKIKAYFMRKQPVDHSITQSAPAAILFTSGSEGNPKGVVLTHANMLANAAQAASRIDFNQSDKVFNVLPMFHSFGLTAATILPLVYGVPVYFYPSPLHYRVIPEAIYASNSTIIFGTDTFLSGYARNAHPYDLRSIRYCFAGAEPVKATTRELMMNKFGIRILEGYGVTECSPLLALNTPMYNKIGSVGKLMPAIEARIEKVENIEKGGRLFVKGPNIMAGYLMVDHPGEILPLIDGWYDTGDIVDIDGDGFVTILGRAKRFAKIGGEMISLSAIEALALKLWPEIKLAIVSIVDAKKGERLVLISEDDKPKRADLLKFAREQGVAEIGIPSKFITASLPLLGSGKIDYASLKQLAENDA